MLNRSSPALLTAALLTQAGCYATTLNTGAPPDVAEFEHRQVFALWGAANLSGDIGKECPSGVATAETRLSGIDWLIQGGLQIGAMLIAGQSCTLPEPGQPAGGYVLCTSAVGALGSLFGTRTTTYHCVAPGSRRSHAPRDYPAQPPAYYPAPPYPGPPQAYPPQPYPGQAPSPQPYQPPPPVAPVAPVAPPPGP